MADTPQNTSSGPEQIQQLEIDLIEIGRWVDSKGWCAATSGNLSARIDQSQILITVSGNAKGALTSQQLMRVNSNGDPFNCDQVPSAETLLHALVYGHDPAVNYVIHTHSVNATVFSRAIWEGEISFKNYEMQKAFVGVQTHEQEIKVPVFANSQNMLSLAQKVGEYLSTQPQVPAFILAGHGVYSWGRNLKEAKRHCEALEFLLECEFKSCLLLK